MQIFDRETELGTLQAALDEVTGGHGSVVAVMGEAGMGKSTLVQAFSETLGAEVQVLRGYCDDLGIAEPLGVLRDLARAVGLEFSTRIAEAGDRLRAFSEALEVFARPEGVTVIVVEDVHWADDATLDFLRFLVRRIADARILVLLTARSDEAQGRNNTRRIIGDAMGRHAQRITLGPLAAETIGRLAREAGQDAEHLIEVTAGNAFFVTELLRGAGGTGRVTVQEAVLARADRLGPEAREVLNATAVFPRPVSATQIAELLERDVDDGIDSCLDMGLLVQSGDEDVGFRHILARQAVLSDLRPGHRRALNGRLLGLLEAEGQASAARLLYHAREAGQTQAVRRLARIAADEAARLGSRREAAEYYKVAVDAEGDAAPADLLEDAAFAAYLVGKAEDAIAYQGRAQVLHAANDNPLSLGDGLRLISRFHWFAGDFRSARDAAQEAVNTLANLRGPELAMAHSNVAQLLMLDRDYAIVREPAEKAIAIAEEFGRPDIISHALNNLGTAIQFTEPDVARAQLSRSLSIALEIGHVDHAARAYVNKTYVEMYLCRFDQAKVIAEEGIRYCREQELDGYRTYLTGALALAELGLGDLDAAGKNAGRALRSAQAGNTGLNRHSGSVAQVRHQIRTGAEPDPAEVAYLETFRSNDTELQRLIPFAECMAELAWMTGQGGESAKALLSDCIRWSKSQDVVQTVHIWLRRLDPTHEPADRTGFLHCHRHELDRDFAAADAAWSENGAPYEQALCLAQGAEVDRAKAANMFEALGAGVAARRVRATLGTDQARGPTTPRASTRANPAGLTRRQMDVLQCLQEGLSNAQIAEKLFVSPKTVDHHVSAILAKLQVKTRAEAAAKANRGELG